MSVFTDHLKEKYSKAWKYFIDFYDQYDGNLNEKGVAFESLSFSMQFGVYLRFFDTINTDVQLYAIQEDVLQESIEEAFATYEEYLFLDS